MFKSYATEEEKEALKREGFPTAYLLKKGGQKTLILKDAVICRWGGSPINGYAQELGGIQIFSVIHGHGHWCTSVYKLDMTKTEFQKAVLQLNPHTRVNVQ